MDKPMSGECIARYREKLERGLTEYMEMPVSERNVVAVTAMVECYKLIKALSDTAACYSDFTEADAETWCRKMQNADGSTGARWPIEQTNDVAMSMGIKWDRITPWGWWATMNMMYSDYCVVAERHGVHTAEFYADMAKAFLMDKDGGEPQEKLAAYYCGIAKQ